MFADEIIALLRSVPLSQIGQSKIRDAGIPFRSGNTLPGPWPVESLSNVLGCFDLISFFVNVCRVFDSIVVGAMRALSAWLQKEND